MRQLRSRLAGQAPNHGRIDVAVVLTHHRNMSTLAEIEEAAAALPAEEKERLMLFLGARLRAEGGKVPEPRRYSREQIQSWIEEDEAEFRKFREQA
jgi:hypothetical protein